LKRLPASSAAVVSAVPVLLQIKTLARLLLGFCNACLQALLLLSQLFLCCCRSRHWQDCC